MALPGLLAHGRGRVLARVCALTLVQGAAAAAAALATRGLFEALGEGAALPLPLLAGLAVSGAVIAWARVAARVAGERLGQAYARDMRLALFDRAAGMAASDVARRRQGYMSLRFVGDMTAFRNWLGLGLPRLVAGAVLIPCALLTLWALDPAFAARVVPLAVLSLGVLALGGLRLVPLHRRLRARRARIAADMAERMPLAPELDRLGRRPVERRRLARRVDRMIVAALARIRAAEALKALPDLVAGLAAALVIDAGARADAAPGAVAGALAALGLMLAPLRDLASVWNFHSAWRAAAAKAHAALDRPQRGTGAGRQALPGGPAGIEIHALPLPSGRHLSLSLAPGARHALDLPTRDAAALMDVLQGLEPVAQDRVRLSGLCLTGLSRGTLRRGVVRVGARPAILQGSLRRALTLGVARRRDDAALVKMARAEGLGPLLDRLGGLDGRVREGGRDLGPDERVALALVRARQLRPRLLLVEAEVAAADPALRSRIEAFAAETGATLVSAARTATVPVEATAT